MKEIVEEICIRKPFSSEWVDIPFKKGVVRYTKVTNSSLNGKEIEHNLTYALSNNNNTTYIGVPIIFRIIINGENYYIGNDYVPVFVSLSESFATVISVKYLEKL